MQSCDAVVVDLEIPLETVECALMTARRLGKPAILDAGPAQTCPMKILAGADIVSPNESELETLSGMPVDGLASAKAAARHLIDQHIPAMVLKLGDKGSLWITNSEEIYAPAVKVEAIDPTAAGDAFTTALAIKWVLRTPIAEALRYANVVGALTTTKMGAMPSLPTQEEVAAFYRENDSLESARQIR
ncbi:MAG: bifunctional hydroxymethylpyrimidine kinase/phosphomethylpyrimidine kinase [Deltaproteobacteria bacterium]|nr:bifunctional hydroxymethylpyrimidine kinase/phosphomethylpyrimidine kinase [Deltaproteobacteria bacterium]